MMIDGYQRPSVYSIAPDLPFLKILAAAILDGTLLPKNYDLHQPFGLCDISIYLPTRRAAQLLEDVLREENGNSSLLLPRIRALGDVDEDSFYFDGFNDLDQPGEALLPALSPLSRQLVLTRLVMHWGETMAGRKSAVRRDDQPLLVPASPADAAWLAGDLGDLLDRATTEGVNWDNLAGLVRHELAAFWQLSLDFLDIVTMQWPSYLAENGLVDAAHRRDLLIAQEESRLATLKGPVIAAGSTGTLPSTAKFLAAVARLPSGSLVLPGFDHDMAENAFAALGGSEKRDEAISGHPQYGLKQLLTHYVKLLPRDVMPLGTQNKTRALRTRIISQAMLPAPVTEQWPGFRARLSEKDIEDAFEHVALIDAKNDAEEALSIACALREFVNQDTGYACLVTPDRALARRVALELRRWGLEVDDSAGRPLIKTAPAVLAQLIIDTVAKGFEPVSLLALLKHPLARFGLDVAHVRRAARVLDLAVLRGPLIASGAKGLARRLRQVEDEVLRGTALIPDVAGKEPSGGQRPSGRLHRAIAGYSAADWEITSTLAHRLIDIFEELETLFHKPDEIDLKDLAAAHLRVLKQVAKDHTGPAGKALQNHFDHLINDDAGLSIKAQQYPKLFRALLGSGTVREQSVQDPRILILGALEARLLAPDFIILSGLDEGVWPKQAETDAFLSRSMRADIAMEAPERRTGLAAHDVCQGLGAPRVLLSRAAKRGGSPHVTSRWLQRLIAFLGEEQAKKLTNRGTVFRNHANVLDKTANLPAIERPNPKPPVKVRPTSLSVTRIETWVRDPYAIYADRILGLSRIDPPGTIPDFADRGTIIHEVLDRFNKVWDGRVNEVAHRRLKEIGLTLFEEEMQDFPDQRALWWPRFERIAAAYLNWEETRDPPALTRHSEVFARLKMDVDGLPFMLTGMIDRIDELSDGSLAIIDFKTGTPPSAKQVKTGLASQLALEVTMQQRGAFDFLAPLSGQTVMELGWVKLDGREDRAHLKSAIRSVRKDKVADTPDDLGKLAEEQLTGLVRRYRDPGQGYMSRPRPDFDFRYEGPYDHLARVKQWQLTGEDNE